MREKVGKLSLIGVSRSLKSPCVLELPKIDYHPFGMVMPERRYDGWAYRFGFEGKEGDNELKGSTNTIDFGDRMYDPRIGRWLSKDKLEELAPGWTPYRAFADDPINVLDPDGGLEFPLKGTHIFYSHINLRVKHRHFVNGNIEIGHKAQYYDFAFEHVRNNVKTEAQKTAEGRGMLVTVTSEWFRLRNVGTSPHIGMDIQAAIGTPIYSLGDGTVNGIGTTKSGIKYLIVQYGNGDKLRFLHLSGYAKGLHVGQKVNEGEVIGFTGNSGTFKLNGKSVQYPAHLHIDAVDKNGVMFDPLSKNYGKFTNEQFFGGDNHVKDSNQSLNSESSVSERISKYLDNPADEALYRRLQIGKYQPAKQIQIKQKSS